MSTTITCHAIDQTWRSYKSIITTVYSLYYTSSILNPFFTFFSGFSLKFFITVPSIDTSFVQRHCFDSICLQSCSLQLLFTKNIFSLSWISVLLCIMRNSMERPGLWNGKNCKSRSIKLSNLFAFRTNETLEWLNFTQQKSFNPSVIDVVRSTNGHLDEFSSKGTGRFLLVSPS